MQDFSTEVKKGILDGVQRWSDVVRGGQILVYEDIIVLNLRDGGGILQQSPKLYVILEDGALLRY